MKKVPAYTISQIKDFIRQGYSITNIISYLFTCDYTDMEIAHILKKYFNCSEESLKFEFKHYFGIEFTNI